MKILLLNANRAGVGTYHRALNFGRQFAKHGHDVTLMTVSNVNRFLPDVRADAERFRIIECPNWLDELLPWHASGPLDILLRMREIRRGRYDVVYAFEYQPNISIPVLSCRPFTRFVLLSDWCDWHAGGSYHFGGYRWAHAIDRYCEEFIRHRADFVTTINKTLHDRAIGIGVLPDRLAVVAEGVDPDYIAPFDQKESRRRLGLPADPPIVATIRDSDSGAELLCAALAKTEARDLRLLHIGQVTPRLSQAARQYGVSERLIAPGRVSDADLPYYLAAADLFALPLEHNLVNLGRWPHKLGDMLAAGRPVVVSRAGEFPELLRQRECAVTVGFDAGEFARAMTDIVNSPERYAAMAARGRELILRELSWDTVGQALNDVLRRAIAA